MANNLPPAAWSPIGQDYFIPVQQRQGETSSPQAEQAPARQAPVSASASSEPSGNPAFSPAAIARTLAFCKAHGSEIVLSTAQLKGEEGRLQRIGKALEKFYAKTAGSPLSAPSQLHENFAKAACGILRLTKPLSPREIRRHGYGPSYAFALSAASTYLESVQVSKKDRKGLSTVPSRNLNAAHVFTGAMEQMVKARSLRASP